MCTYVLYQCVRLCINVVHASMYACIRRVFVYVRICTCIYLRTVCMSAYVYNVCLCVCVCVCVSKGKHAIMIHFKV